MVHMEPKTKRSQAVPKTFLHQQRFHGSADSQSTQVKTASSSSGAIPTKNDWRGSGEFLVPTTKRVSETVAGEIPFPAAESCPVLQRQMVQLNGI